MRRKHFVPDAEPIIIKEHVINEHLSVGMTSDYRIGVLIDGKWMAQCRHALLDVHDGNDAEFITMDDAIDKLENHDLDKRKVDRETEFIAHASNIQAWAEYDYDPRLLVSDLASRILLELSRKDERIKRKMEGEMIERFVLMPDDHKLWFFENYYPYLVDEALLDTIDRMLDAAPEEPNTNLGTTALTEFLDLCTKEGINARKLMKIAIKHANQVELFTDAKFIKKAFLPEIIAFVRGLPIDNLYLTRRHTEWHIDHISRKYIDIVLNFTREHVNEYLSFLDKENIENILFFAKEERPLFFLALTNEKLRAIFSDDDWRFLSEKFDSCGHDLSAFINMHFESRAMRWHERYIAALKEIYGKEYVIAKIIASESGSFHTASIGHDYPAFLWATNEFKKMQYKSKRFPGAIYKYAGVEYSWAEMILQPFVIYRVADENGKISYVTWFKKKKMHFSG